MFEAAKVGGCAYIERALLKLVVDREVYEVDFFVFFLFLIITAWLPKRIH